jgi:hypothetical protein|tara:strand:+ start:7186 stop:7536 length:351 start_codon:yes stop_codon:yes gene_type:complete
MTKKPDPPKRPRFRLGDLVNVVLPQGNFDHDTQKHWRRTGLWKVVDVIEPGENLKMDEHSYIIKHHSRATDDVQIREQIGRGPVNMIESSLVFYRHEHNDKWELLINMLKGNENAA